jgi:hypothetical protein
MIDLLLAVVVPKLADITIIARRFRLAIDAIVAGLLRCSTYHAKHVLRQLSVQIVIFGSIVTMPAGVPMMAFETLHLHIALIVLAAEGWRCSSDIVVLFFTMLRGCMLPWWAVRGIRVARSQAVWVRGVNLGCG